MLLRVRHGGLVCDGWLVRCLGTHTHVDRVPPGVEKTDKTS